MTSKLLKVAQHCDGVRCDMAMLLLPEVIQRTWAARSQPSDGSLAVDAPFWPAAIAQVRQQQPNFCFLAEVYWDLEWQLQQQGFDYTYDKCLYDRLRTRQTDAVREHLRASLDFLSKAVHFLENHDESRAAQAFVPEVHRAAAAITFFVPGMRFFHEGQLEGRKQHPSNHLGRRAAEPLEPALRAFYQRLLELLHRPLFREGNWRLLPCQPIGNDNATWKQFVAFFWEYKSEYALIVVNYGAEPGCSQVRLDGLDLVGGSFLLRDRMSSARHLCSHSDLLRRGLSLEMPAWHFHLFDVLPVEG